MTADAALGRGLSREAVLSSVPLGGPGRLTVLRALALADGRSGSPLESLGRVRLLQGGLPPAELQVDLGDGDRAIVVDHLWRQQRTVAEADGASKYRTAADVWAEKRREDRLRDAGWEVVRYTWDDALHHPHRIVERVRRAFARAQARHAA